MGSREVAILNDYLNLWTRSIIELLDKLKDTVPESQGMLAEINYWRDMSRVLDAINNELKQSYVEMVVQILTCAKFDKDIAQF